MKTVEAAIQRSLKRSNVEAVEDNKFGTEVRQLGISAFQNGDIVTIPTDYKVLKEDMDGGNVAKFIHVNVKRGTKDTVVPLYPSLFFKQRRVVDENGLYTGEWKVAEGEVVDFVQDFDTIDDALPEIIKHGSFKINLSEPFLILRYGEDEGGKTQKATVPNITWA